MSLTGLYIYYQLYICRNIQKKDLVWLPIVTALSVLLSPLAALSEGENICGQMAMDGHLSDTEQDANWRDPNIFAGAKAPKGRCNWAA